MKKRCPWCGEEVHSHFTRFYHCPKCNKKSKVYTDGWIYAIGAFSILLLYIFLSEHFKISVSLVLVIWYVLSSAVLPLKIESKHFVPRRKAAISVTLLREYSFFKKRYIFSENRIFVICFVDDNEVPISHMLCVSTEDVKFISQKMFESNMFFIPMMTNNAEFSKGTKFYVFDEKDKIAYGVLKSDVE